MFLNFKNDKTYSFNDEYFCIGNDDDDDDVSAIESILFIDDDRLTFKQDIQISSYYFFKFNHYFSKKKTVIKFYILINISLID